MTTPADVRPPAWAELFLRLLLKRDDRDSVTGDLLEEYRDSIRPARGRWRADAWYLMQVAGFAWRSAGVFGVLFAGSFLTRMAFDWFAPPADFVFRSIVTTFTAVAIFTSAGALTAWRLRSVGAGALVGFTTGVIAAALTSIVALVVLAIWHDRQTMAAIAGSGGLNEVFTLPLLVTAPGTICAALGAIAGKGLAWSLGSRLAE